MGRIRSAFLISKEIRECLPLSLLVALLSVAEYASISPNILKYLWKKLNKLRSESPIMEKYLSRRSLIKHTCSWRDKLIVYYEHWTDKQKYFHVYLHKLFWLCQGSEYAWSSYMFDRLLKMSWVLNVPGFWIWHGCICINMYMYVYARLYMHVYA